MPAHLQLLVSAQEQRGSYITADERFSSHSRPPQTTPLYSTQMLTWIGSTILANHPQV